MALTTQENAIWQVYLDDQQPNAIQRAEFKASDDLVRTTLSAWQPSAIEKRLEFINEINSVAKKINAELAPLNAYKVVAPS